MYFGEFSRAVFVLSSPVNSLLAELFLKNFCNKWGGGEQGGSNQPPPIYAKALHSLLNASVPFDFLPDLEAFFHCKVVRAFHTLPLFYDLSPPVPPRTKAALKLLYATRPRIRWSSRPIISDVRVSAWIRRDPQISKNRTFPFIVPRMFFGNGELVLYTLHFKGRLSSL